MGRWRRSFRDGRILLWIRQLSVLAPSIMPVHEVGAGYSPAPALFICFQFVWTQLSNYVADLARFGAYFCADHPAFVFQVVGQSRDDVLTVVQAGGRHPGSQL
jgi:hypothetical protein